MSRSTMFNSNYKGFIYKIPDHIIDIKEEPIGKLIDLTTTEKILAEQKIIYDGLKEVGILTEEEQTEEDALIAPYGYTKSGKIRTKPLKSQSIVNGLE